jgi:hypothetical protein
MARFVFTKKRRMALAKARRKWKNMSHAARMKAMPNRRRR